MRLEVVTGATSACMFKSTVLSDSSKKKEAKGIRRAIIGKRYT